jgi:hypothetical protein
MRDEIMGKALDAAKAAQEREKKKSAALTSRIEKASSLMEIGKLHSFVAKDLSAELGPYAPGEEARFKKDLIKRWEARNDGWHYFCVESPDTMRGFPDVLAISDRGRYQLYELKVSDNKGFIKFERTQPLFYKKHDGVHALVVAWDVPLKQVVFLSAVSVALAGVLRVRLPREDEA